MAKPAYSTASTRRGGRQRQRKRESMSSLVALFAFCTVVSLLNPAVSASALPPPPPPPPSPVPTLPPRIDQYTLRHLEINQPESLQDYGPILHLRKRQEREGESESAGQPSSGPTSTAVVASPLPSPFDGNLAATFTNPGCPEFINNFLTDARFKYCYPFSMLLQGSVGFFQAQKSAVAMTQVLQATCAADVEQCAPYLAEIAQQLLLDENCKEEFDTGQRSVQEAYFGLTAYRELYSASCLQDKGDQGFCFTSAVTNYTTTANTYVYYLPLNLTLPEGSEPTCNQCVQNTMQIFHSATSNRNLPIAATYESAAQQINLVCGDDWLNTTLPIATVGSSAAGRTQGKLAESTSLAALAVLAVILHQLF